MASTSSSTRERVLQFETELEQNIYRASKIENEIIKLAQMRRQFVESMTISGTGAGLIREKIKISRSETSIIALDMILSEHEVKEIKSSQELPLAELATTPLKQNESYESRATQTQELITANQEAVIDFISSVISDARNFKAKLQQIQYEALNFEKQLAESNAESIQNIEASVLHFNEKLNEYIAQSTVIRKKVTGDYLILRHNARIAEKILCERRQSAVSAREEMQKNLDALVKDASRRRAEVEETLNNEQTRLLQEARQNVMKKESEVRALGIKVQTRMAQVKRDKLAIKSEIKNYDTLYKNLERRREKEVRSITVELKKFRDMLSAVEEKLIITK